MLIIGILAAVALPQYTRAVEKSRASEALILVKAIASANEIYKMENGDYTNDIAELVIEMPGTDLGGTVRSYKTKNFELRADCYTGAAASGNCIALVRRKDTNTFYFQVLKAKPGQILCGADSTAEANRICGTFGPKSCPTCNTWTIQ